MNCPEYQILTPKEKTEMIGKLLHAIQSDSTLFLEGSKLIKKAEKKGIFDGIIINPPNNIDA